MIENYVTFIKPILVSSTKMKHKCDILQLFIFTFTSLQSFFYFQFINSSYSSIFCKNLILSHSSTLIFFLFQKTKWGTSNNTENKLTSHGNPKVKNSYFIFNKLFTLLCLLYR